MSNEILLSVVIPCYNCEKYLPKCINSLLEQSFNSYEIIIVDDGSTDNSLKIANNYKKSNKRISIITQKNQGGIIARKTGIIAARGEYVFLMDADDWISSSTFNEIFEYIKKYNHPDIIKYKYINEPSKTESLPYLDGISLDTVLEKNELKKVWDVLIYTDKFNSIWSCFFKKKLFNIDDKVFTHIVRKGEDLQINLQIMQKTNSVLFINKAYYHYRSNPNGVTQLVTPEKMVRNCNDRLYLTKEKIRIYKDLYNECDEEKIWSEYASILVSQLVKLLRKKETTKEDLIYISDKFDKLNIKNEIKEHKIEKVCYRGSNLFNRIILNKMLKNLLNDKNMRNYKYKFLFQIYYKYK